jgi:signal transduction histidine kinase
VSADVFQHYIVVMQVPIVCLLVIFSMQAVTAFGAKEFNLVALGWLSNFIYLLFSHVHFSGWAIPRLSNESITFLAAIFDGTTALCFLLAARKYLKIGPDKPHLLSHIPLAKIALAVVGIGSIGVFSSVFLTSLPAISKVPSVLLSMAGILALAGVYNQALQSQHQRPGPSNRRLLVGGTIAYALIQPIAIFTSGEDWAAVSGFSLGFLSKASILVGLSGGFVIRAQDAVRSEILERRMSAVARTVGRITHELGTPIRHLDVQVSKLRRLAPSHGDFTSHLAGLESTVLRIDSVIEATLALLPSPERLIDISSIARDPSGALPASQREVVNVNTLVQLALMVVKETRGEQVLVRTSFSGNCCTESVPFEFVQVLINLLRNAYDAVRRYPRGMLQITTRNTEAQTIEIEVVDDGHGIPPEKLQDIFEEGYTTRSGPGRGYGLAIVKQLVESNGGQIRINSPTNSTGARPGTTVVLTFPRVKCLAREERSERHNYATATRDR